MYIGSSVDLVWAKAFFATSLHGDLQQTLPLQNEDNDTETHVKYFETNRL